MARDRTFLVLASWIVCCAWPMRAEQLDPARIKVAECRAACFEDESIAADSLHACKSNPECYMCWETCDMFVTNFVVWGPMCTVDSICFSGCRRSCQVYSKIVSNGDADKPRANVSWLIDRAVKVDDKPLPSMTTFKWKHPFLQKDVNTISKMPAFVYIVAQKCQDKEPWEEILQTSDQYATVSSSLLTGENSNFRLFVVTEDGVVAKTAITSGKMSAKSKQNEMKSLPPKKWTPTLLSLREDGQSKAGALIAWDGVRVADKYDVTWRLLGDSMDITGHLYTWKNITSLSLYLGSVYSIQVSGLNSEGEVVSTSSELIVNTVFLGTPAASDIDLDEAQGCFGIQNPLMFVVCAVGISAVLVSVFGVACYVKIFRNRRSYARDQLSAVCCDDGEILPRSPLPVVQKKLTFVPRPGHEPVGPHLSLVKKLSRRLSNLELQYSPLSPLRQGHKKEEGLPFVEKEEEEDNDVFLFPVSDDIPK